ncbi:MAG: hypothetical protein PHS41_03155 [Victivallaceae bacterium]|nr:hypothetical protein [Victivallaceae bacterium]
MCRTFIVLALLTLLTGGCLTFRHDPKDTRGESPAPEALTEEVLVAQDKFAREVGDGMLAALRDGNYEKFSAHFTAEQQKSMTAEKFKGMREGIGKVAGTLVSFHYLDRLDQSIFCTYIWKVVFEKAEEKKASKSASLQRRTLLFAVIIGRADGKFQLLGSRFLN